MKKLENEEETMVELPEVEKESGSMVNVDLKRSEEKTGLPSEEEWRQGITKTVNEGLTFEDLGFRLKGWIETSDSPLGEFVRSFCQSTQPPLSAELCHERRGDLLPIHPFVLRPGSLGITSHNVHWVQAAIYALNFSYCCGWSKPVCVPIAGQVTRNQQKAVFMLARQIDRTMIGSDQLPKMGKLKENLNSKRFDYSGNPVEHMLELDAEKVIEAWPRPGAAAKVEITSLLSAEMLSAIGDPKDWWLPHDRKPSKATRSKVRASDETWFKICSAAHERGMMRPVNDGDLCRDREGHFVVNGAGGVAKKKEKNGVVVELQRFISILIPSNEHSVQLPGEQDSLPYVGQLTGIVLEEENDLYLHSEDFTSAFNLFAVPPAWSVHFAFAKKVKASAFGGDDKLMVRPALSVIPMGWKSAVTLVQAAVRHIVFDRCQIPRSTSLEKNLPIPQLDAEGTMMVVYLDNYDEIKCYHQLSRGEHSGQSENQKRFNKVCDELRLERNLGKQLIGSFTGSLQGGELDGQAGTFRMAPDKLRGFIGISVAMLASETWREFHLRHWVGKAAFAAAFKRPLFAILQEVFELIQEAQGRDVAPSKDTKDEVLTMMVLSVLGEADLRAQISDVISCTDASPSGGGAAVAAKFKDKGFDYPIAVEDRSQCGSCGKAVIEREDPRLYPCSRRCGKHSCSLVCAQDHEGECERGNFFSPKFGERFCGPNFPLTKAVALAGINTQAPLDKLRSDCVWDFFTEPGKKKLENEEEDPELGACHWAPNCRTFSRSRGRPMTVKGKGKVKGPPAVRSADQPWGLAKASKDDQIKVRQDNKMALRSLKGLKDGNAAGRYVSLEHPWGSLLWETPEAKDLLSHPDFYCTEYSSCCYGGERVKWTILLHNCRELHVALHRPVCPGHENLKSYEVRVTPQGYEFDTALEAEYPWGFCVAYAAALKQALHQRLPPPVGGLEPDFGNLIYSQVRGATRGLQNEDFVLKVVKGVKDILNTMGKGEEREHLKQMMRYVGLRGTDVRLTVKHEEIERKETVIPYPAMRWLWRTVMAYRWSEKQHINILEATAVLVEFRRRVRNPNGLGIRFFNVIDSVVIYYAMAKGRSSSKKLNRTLRRVMALALFSRSTPVNLWTLSKWNFADKPSRQFEGTSSKTNA